uniref:Uncharacterized protein n=1 Tax=Opuntia streptacantha TaxID=393608 RepID=A0A7C8ZIU6_OPUST
MRSLCKAGSKCQGQFYQHVQHAGQQQRDSQGILEEHPYPSSDYKPSFYHNQCQSHKRFRQPSKMSQQCWLPQYTFLLHLQLSGIFSPANQQGVGSIWEV